MIIKVERKIYNTETAELIAETAQGSYGDSTGFEEKLYKRGPRDYFIFGHGGENSPYPQPGLFVLSAQDARAWLERVVGAEAVDQEFNVARKTVVKKAVAKKETEPEVKAEPEAKKAPAKKAAVKKEVVAEGADVKAAPATKKVAVKKVAAEKAPKAPKAVKAPKA
ncbi:MAG: hypothetical protein PHQ83_12085 [Eubacteriales bacterium]|nr:hypothetical protein [Eubacteriales bacterium]